MANAGYDRLRAMSDHPHPLGSLGLFGLADRRLDILLTALLVVVILVSRIIAFPSSIWEQDEAIFAAAVIDFDPADNLPHPPWFPLWIAAGKLVHQFGFAATTSLQLVSLAFSVWMVFPLTAMWSPVVGRRLAVGAAILFLVAPGPWFFSGRAFCGTTATALLVAALAFWLQAEDRPRWLLAGSFSAGLAALVRPQLLPAIIVAGLMISFRSTGSSQSRFLAALAAPLGLGLVVLIISAGGLAPLWSAFVDHATYHLSRLDLVDHGFVGSGFSRSLGYPAIAVAWLILFHIGMIRLIRQGRFSTVTPVLIGALLPCLVVIHGLSNSGHARYAIPVLALMSGLVVLGLRTLAGRWTGLVIGATIATSIVILVPQLFVYRSTTSPPAAAIDAALMEARIRGGTVVADSTLHAFFTLRRLDQPSDVPVLFDHLIELGHTPPPPATTVFIFDLDHDRILVDGEERMSFSTELPMVRRLAQDRFIDLTVITGATLKP